MTRSGVALNVRTEAATLEPAPGVYSKHGGFTYHAGGRDRQYSKKRLLLKSANIAESAPLMLIGCLRNHAALALPPSLALSRLDEYARTHSLQEENARTRLTLARKDQQTSRPPLRSKFSSQRDSVSSAPSTPGVGGATSRTNSSVMDSFMVVDAHGRGAHRRTSGRRASNNTYISFDGDDAVPKQQHDAVKRELELAEKELASAQRLSEHKDRQIAAADQQLRQLQIALAQMVRPSRIGTHPSWDGTADALELHMRLESRATVEAVRRILPQLRLGDDVNNSDGPKATERPGPAPPQGMSLLTIPVRYGVDGTDETPVPSPAIQADKNNNNTDIDPARAAPVDTLAPVHPRQQAPVHPRQQACGSQHTGSAPSLPSPTAAVATPGVPAVATAAATSARPAASLSNSDLVGRKLSDSDVSVTPVTPSEFAEDLSSSVRSLLAKKHVDNSAQAEELRLRQEEYLS